MKHHYHSIGWREANGYNVPLWEEFLSLGACHALVIGLVVMAILTVRK